MKISRDTNGNKILKVEKSDTVNGDFRGFSIQTNGNLSLTHSMGLNYATMIEVKTYVKQYGTIKQREALGL